jgi:hypothetical protein
LQGKDYFGTTPEAHEKYFDCLQHMHVIKSGELFFRAMTSGKNTWPIRATHLFRSLERIFEFYGEKRGTKGFFPASAIAPRPSLVCTPSSPPPLSLVSCPPSSSSLVSFSFVSHLLSSLVPCLFSFLVPPRPSSRSSLVCPSLVPPHAPSSSLPRLSLTLSSKRDSVGPQRTRGRHNRHKNIPRGGVLQFW